MSRWTGEWLSGTGAVQGPAQDFRGERLGLPQDGVGSLAGFGRRLAGLFVDWLPCAAVAMAFTRNPEISALVLFAVLTVSSVALFGRTPGHAAVGVRIAVLAGGRISAVAAFGRGLLLCLAIPALIMDDDGRGVHERLTGTAVVRTR